MSKYNPIDEDADTTAAWGDDLGDDILADEEPPRYDPPTPAAAPASNVDNVAGSMAGANTNTQSSSSSASASASTANQRAPRSSPGKFWNLSFYEQYFDVDAQEVGEKIVQAVNPLSGGGQSSTYFLDQPADLYGPFWIASTLIFSLFFANTLVGLIKNSSGEKFSYEFGLITANAALTYSYTFLVPGALFLLLNYWDIGATSPHLSKLVNLIAVYGYSQCVWILICAGNIILPVWLPVGFWINLVGWVLTTVGFLSSGWFLLKALYFPVRQNSPHLHLRVLVLVLLLHVGFSLAVKFAFFKGVVPVKE